MIQWNTQTIKDINEVNNIDGYIDESEAYWINYWTKSEEQIQRNIRDYDEKEKEEAEEREIEKK